MTACTLTLVLVVGRAAGARVVAVAASRTATVELHPIPSARDAVALTSTLAPGVGRAVVAEGT